MISALNFALINKNRQIAPLYPTNNLVLKKLQIFSGGKSVCNDFYLKMRLKLVWNGILNSENILASDQKSLSNKSRGNVIGSFYLVRVIIM